MNTEKCPYLENGQFCTHKGYYPRIKIGKRRVCGYFDHETCPLLKKSKSLLRTVVNACSKPFKSGVKA